MSRFLSAVSIVLSLSGCAGPGAPSCASGLGARMMLYTLYFGKAISGRGDLTDTEWQMFLDGTITANLPNGYTIFDATGAWMNPVTHKTGKENTKVLIVALPDGPGSLTAINRVRTAYQTEFHQQLVGMTVQSGCGTF
jgi:hypothetical protein